MTMAEWKTITERQMRARGNSYMIRSGAVLVSFADVNRGFWSHLGCPGRKATMFKSSRYLLFLLSMK